MSGKYIIINMKINKIYSEIKEEKENEIKDDSIKMDRADFIKEHENLIKVLRSGDKKLLEAEAKKQEEELKIEIEEEDE